MRALWLLALLIVGSANAGGMFQGGGGISSSCSSAGIAYPPNPFIRGSKWKNSLSFCADLATSIMPGRALGSPTPTFSRGSNATFSDWEGIIRTVLFGEARFQGARRVRNTVTNSTAITGSANSGGTGSAATFSSNFGVAPDGTTTAHRIVATLNGGTLAADFSYWDVSVAAIQMASPVHSVWIKNNGGTTSVLLRHNTAISGYVVAIDNTWRRYSIQSVSVAGGGGTFTIGVRGNVTPAGAIDILVWQPQWESTEGQSNVNPSEYVSTGVLSAPFQGANVDGVQYFANQNGNTVASNVVTAGTGAAISGATLQGIIIENQKFNLGLWSEDYSNVVWVKTRATVSADATVAPDGNSTADKLVEDATAASTHFVTQTTNFGNSVYTYAQYFKASTRTKAVLIMDDNVGGVVSVPVDVGGGTVGSTVTGGLWTGTTARMQSLPNGWYRASLTSTRGAAGTNVLMTTQLADGTGATSYNGDGVSGLFVWGGDLDNGPYASTYIQTTSGIVGRSDESLNYAFAGNCGFTQGTAYAELTTLWNGTSTNFRKALHQGLGAAGTLYSFLGDPTTALGIHDNPNTAKITGVSDMSTAPRKRATSWGPANLKATGDGAVPNTSGASVGNMGNSSIQVGGDTGNTLHWDGMIKNLRLFTIQLPDAMISRITQ